jgi:hypothetical protein
MEILLEVFPYFVRVNKQFEMPHLFRIGLSQIAIIRITYFSIGIWMIHFSNASKETLNDLLMISNKATFPPL